MVHITTFLENFLKKILGELIQVLLNGLSSIFSFKSVPENCFSRNFSMNASGIATMIRSEIPLFIFIDFFENYSISSPDSSSRNSSEYYTAENFFQKCCKEFLQIFFLYKFFRGLIPDFLQLFHRKFLRCLIKTFLYIFSKIF